MTKIEIFMNSGNKKVVEVEVYDPKEFETELNNRETMMVAIGDIIVQKHAIQMIAPLEEETTTTEPVA